MRIRVATFNLHQGLRQWEKRRELIVPQMMELNADILCLNEISILLDTGRWIWQQARARGLRYAFVQQTKTSGLGECEGQGILTRFPVAESGMLDFEARGRIAQVVRLQIGHALIDVYLTHLHHVRDEDGMRQYQVQRLLHWIAARDTPLVRLVCGDFNATLEMRSIQLMREQFTATQSEPTFATPLRYQVDPDPFDTGEHTPDGFTACLDYVWFQPPLRLVEGGCCFDKPDRANASLWPSDHVGIWADFEIPSNGS